MSEDDLSDFTTTATKTGSSGTGTWLVTHGLAWGLVIALLVFGVPRVEAIFVDFGVDLPASTKLVIKASHLWWALLPAVGVLLAVDGLVLAALSRNDDAWGRRAWSLAMLAAPILVLAMGVAGLAWPLFSITWRLVG